MRGDSTAVVTAYLRAIDTKRTALLDAVALLDPAKQCWRPDAHSWSAVDIIEHLVFAERVVIGDVRTAPARRVRPPRVRDRVRAFVVWIVLRFGVRVSVPAESMRPTGDASFEVLRAQWIEQHRLLRAYVESLDERGLCQRVFHHPIAGPLSVRQALGLLDAHLGTHQRQLARLLRAQRHPLRDTPPVARTTDASTP